MKYRQFGNTEQQVSILSLGGAALGAQYGPVDQLAAKEMLHEAIDLGINLIDTSPYYGLGKSEEFLGQHLTPELRKKVLLCTKAGRYDRDVFDFSTKSMRNSLEKSLKRLNTDYVDVLLAHYIEFAEDFDAVFNETYNGLLQLKREGKCRWIGMSCFPLGLLEEAISRCKLDVVISYCHYTLQNDLLTSSFLPKANQSGVGVMNGSPLSMGLLTRKGPPAWHPANDEIQRVCRSTASWLAEQGIDIAQVGMQFALANPAIPTTLMGVADPMELRSNTQALERPLEHDLFVQIAEKLRPAHNLTWPSGRWPVGNSSPT
ncbi:MAG: aldo/keto reductase [Zavarzinella sp.]